ncbi:MAG: hypothetical protein HXY36_01610 [Chloroflexi bacterium]|nr:hypothetical protein [Chloroflexota bacterium]
MGTTVKDDVLVLGGREFKRVKIGLDEAQVTSFINELINERDKLAKAYEHITSLNRLAERTIVEADKLATQIKTEAAEQAKAQSAAIIDKAKEEARQLAEKKIAEAVALANEQANAIKAKAEEEAAKLLENEKNKIRAELRNLVNQQFGYMLEELENLKRQAAAVQANFDNKLSEPRVESSAAAAKIAEEKDTVVAKIAEKRDATAAETAKESAAIVAEEIKKTLEAHPEPSRTMNQIEKSSDLSNLFQIEDQVELGKPQWEVEILPPFEIAKIMEVVSFLDQLPEVANTEMIVPQIDMPSILVFLRKPLNLVDVLQTIPAVAYVEKITTDLNATNKKPRKVRITLSGNTTSPGKK